MAQSVEQSTQARDESDLHFDPFRLEKTKRLWREESLVDVRPQSLARAAHRSERSASLPGNPSLTPLSPSARWTELFR